jgi:hypothetical protein
MYFKARENYHPKTICFRLSEQLYGHLKIAFQRIKMNDNMNMDSTIVGSRNDNI